MKPMAKVRNIKDKLCLYAREPELMPMSVRVRWRRIKRNIRRVVYLFAVITLWMLIFGDSRLIEDAPIVWRVQYEWHHLIGGAYYHLFAPDSEGVYLMHKLR